MSLDPQVSTSPAAQAAGDAVLSVNNVEVVYDHRSTPRRFEIAIGLGAGLSPEQLSRLDAVAAACPVRRAIEHGAEFSERVHVGAHSSA